MATFEDFLSEGKKLQIKRKYTENHPAKTVGKTANVRNAVLQAIKDGMVTREEFNKILSELSADSRQWSSRNRKYFNVSEEGIKLSKWGRRILAELDGAPKSAEVFEAKVEMDAINPDDKDFLKFLKKNRVKIINKEMDGPGGGHPVITMQGKRKDLEKVLADPELGWDNPDLAEYIEESVNEKIKVTKDKFPYIEFKDGGKKYEVDFDQGDIIDDHGNEGKDWYYVGVDQHGDEWEIDVYTDYRDEPEDWFYDTIKRADESVVNESVAPDKVTAEGRNWDVGTYKHPHFGELIAFRFMASDKMKWHLDMKVEKERQDDFYLSNMGALQGMAYFPKEKYDVKRLAKEMMKVAEKAEDKDPMNFKVKPGGFYEGKKVVLRDYVKALEAWVELRDSMGIANESNVDENYEVIYSDGMKGLKKFPNERKARAFFNDKIKQKGMRDVALYRAGSGFHSTTQTEYVIAFWGDGSYLDNVSKKDADLAKKKVTENKDMKNEINLFESFGDFVGANFLNERLGSQIMAQIFMSNRQGSYAKKELSNLAKGFYNMSKVALDKIQDEDFIVSADPSKVFKNYGGANHVLFFISDNQKENPYAPRDAYSSDKVVPGGGILLAAMSGDRMFYTNHWSRWSGGASWSKEKKGSSDQIGISHKYKGWDATGLSNGKRISEVSDRVIVLNLDLVRQKYSTQQLRDARAAAKAGATAFKSDKDFKDANKKRYHDILATKAANLPLDKMVEDAIDKLAKQISDGLKKGEKTQYNEIKIGESPKGREVKAKDASAHMSSILDAYSRYCDYIRQAEESEKRYGERESYYERESKNYAKEIKNKIEKIDTYDYAW